VLLLRGRRLRGCEIDPLLRLLSMLGRLGGGAAQIFCEPKEAFTLQAPELSNGQEGERPACSLATGLAPGRTQTLELRSAQHRRGGGGIVSEVVERSFCKRM